VEQNTFDDGEEGEPFVPTPCVLLVLGLLIILVIMGIGLELYAWAKNKV
jgi:hypothetical protein